MKKGETWFVDVPEGRGNEQKGKRPCIVLGEKNGVVCAVPLTSNDARYQLSFTELIEQTPKNGLREDSIALIFQLKSLSKERFLEKIGEIDEKTQDKIDVMIKEMLKIK